MLIKGDLKKKNETKPPPKDSEALDIQTPTEVKYSVNQMLAVRMHSKSPSL